MNNAYKWQLLTKGTFAGSLGCHFSKGLTVFGFFGQKINVNILPNILTSRVSYM